MLQRTWQIWSFAFAFAVRYLALGWRITYGRAGMTADRVVERCACLCFVVGLAFSFAVVAASCWKQPLAPSSVTEDLDPNGLDRRRKLAAWLRDGLVKLGPTFIKIGQQFSTRVDVLSKEFVAELEMLQVGRRPRKLAACLCLSLVQACVILPASHHPNITPSAALQTTQIRLVNHGHVLAAG